MATLKPFRDYDEKDVINLFALDLTGLDVSTWDKRVKHGAVVKVSVGWDVGQELEMLGNVGDSSDLKNVTSQRYGVKSKVALTSAGDSPLGLTLFHVAKVDENGELLKFSPRKAAELEACIEGQAVPVVHRGMFLVSGIDVTTAVVVAGASLYAGAAGSITTEAASNKKIGIALGVTVNGNTLIKLDI